MASGLILGILFMRYQKWYLAAVAAGILFGIVWNLWHNTIRNCSEKDSMANARAWIYPVFRVGCFLIFFLAGAFHFAENEAFRQIIVIYRSGRKSCHVTKFFFIRLPMMIPSGKPLL